jgi:hypothetical protein
MTNDAYIAEIHEDIPLARPSFVKSRVFTTEFSKETATSMGSKL